MKKANSMDSFAPNKKELQKLCERHQVKTLYAFGSVLGTDFHKSSDLDLVVDFKDLNVHESSLGKRKRAQRLCDLGHLESP